MNCLPSKNGERIGPSVRDNTLWWTSSTTQLFYTVGNYAKYNMKICRFTVAECLPATLEMTGSHPTFSGISEIHISNRYSLHVGVNVSSKVTLRHHRVDYDAVEWQRIYTSAGTGLLHTINFLSLRWVWDEFNWSLYIPIQLTTSGKAEDLRSPYFKKKSQSHMRTVHMGHDIMGCYTRKLESV